MLEGSKMQDHSGLGCKKKWYFLTVTGLCRIVIKVYTTVTFSNSIGRYFESSPLKFYYSLTFLISMSVLNYV